MNASPAEQAGAWDARLRAPDCTDEDRARFAAWRDANPANRNAFELLQTIVASLSHDRGRADVGSLRADALRVVSARQRRRLPWWSAVAASVIALATCTALWNTPIGERLGAPIMELASRLKGAETFSTANGQRSTFTLQDGSSVELNSQSCVKVSFTQTRRTVELEKGQALFTVAKSPHRPFVVRAGNREIVAVGTQFDVRLDSRFVQVTLLEGKVRVRSPDSPLPMAGANGMPQRENATSPGTAEVVLTPGKQLIARLIPFDRKAGRGSRDSGRASPSGVGEGATVPAAGNQTEADDLQADNAVRDIDVAKVTGWRDGQVYLEDLSLQDAVEEMNKHSLVQIRVSGESLARIRVNGMFRAGEQEAFVSALEEYYPISAEHRGDREIVLGPQH